MIDSEMLFRKYGAMVMRRCRQLLKNEQDAMDALMDVFVKAIEQGDRLSERYPSSLLYRIATNICLNKIRERRRRPQTEGDELLDQIAGLEDFGQRIEAMIHLRFLFRHEFVSTKEIAVYHYLDGMSLKEVARETGMSVSGVRKRLRNLREKLTWLEEQES